MGVRGLLDKSDVLGVLRLLNRLHETKEGAASRWPILLGGLCELAGGGVGMLAVGQARGGWSAAQVLGLDGAREGVMSAAVGQGKAGDPAMRKLLRRVRARQAGATVTCLRSDLIDDDAWYASEHVARVRRPAGLDDCVYSAHVVSPANFACLMVYRGWGERRAFGERERLLVDVSHQGCAWVHRRESPAASAIDALSLSPRERETFGKLLAGRGEKQIAAEMRLSVNTVHHYVKALYRHFGVSSRAELLAKWMGREHARPAGG